jgi:hypothetical protein
MHSTPQVNIHINSIKAEKERIMSDHPAVLLEGTFDCVMKNVFDSRDLDNTVV